MAEVARDHEKAQAAWVQYRDAFVRNNNRRQLRRREFMAGFMAGTESERERTQKYVGPMNQRLYELVRSLDENPDLVAYIQASIPNTVKKLVTFLETGKRPKEQNK